MMRPYLIATLLLSAGLAWMSPSVAAVEGNGIQLAETAEAYPLTKEDKAFVKSLQDALAKDDRAWIVDHVDYPMLTSIGGHDARIQTKAEFLAHFDEIMNARVRAAIANQKPDDLFKNWQGTMIGNGEVWFEESVSLVPCTDFVPSTAAFDFDSPACQNGKRREFNGGLRIITINNVFPTVPVKGPEDGGPDPDDHGITTSTGH
ncbi:MAG TPA: hypothetical protein VFO61_05490 [Alphaproteobacteria bacterium]|nr:hypothetical protein [Alphaproteobacteria bacterium]